MKKNRFMVLMVALLAMGLPTMAQKNNTAKPETLVKKMQSIWKKAKKQVSETGKELGE
ncbi:MAG: Tat pathway signal sequence, partial [Prevotella sp.]|nr:Tat pathway signal sequence [Prevotella sp.]